MSSNDDDEITVIGYFPPLRGGTGNTIGGGGGGGTGGGGGQRPPPAWMAMDALNAAEEVRADNKAKEARDQILLAVNQINQEYVIGMCQTDPGAFVLGIMVPGNNEMSQGQWPAVAQSQRQCIAIIHNHTLTSSFNPDGSFNEQNFERAKRPSEEPGRDRDGMDKIIRDGGNPLALRYYIIGPDGILRKYMYNSPRGVTGPVVQ